MLVKFEKTCVTKQATKASIRAPGQMETTTDIVPNTYIESWLNPAHVVSLDIHTSGRTVISMLMGGRIIDEPIGEVAARLNAAAEKMRVV